MDALFWSSWTAKIRLWMDSRKHTMNSKAYRTNYPVPRSYHRYVNKNPFVLLKIELREIYIIIGFRVISLSQADFFQFCLEHFKRQNRHFKSKSPKISPSAKVGLS